MKKCIKQLMVIFVVLGLMVPNFSVFASSDDFNPNYLISDEEIQNWQSMNREDIQAFLRQYGGSLSGHRSEDLDGVRRTASDIIYRAAREHKINPKYLLVKLQKEQSLVTTKSPTQKQLDWAAGYGICDSCSMSDPTLQKHRGFGTQVDSAAAIIRWYYDNLNTERWIKRTNKTYSIDGITVRPANLATAFLYTYTPHILGNKNFWNLWQKWFDQVYPNGSLIKAEGSPTIYLIKDGEKRAFKNISSLVTRFDPKLIISVPKTELKNYVTGSEISLPNYSILKTGSKYYLLDNDSVRPFASYDVVKKLGYHPDEIVEVNSSDILSYSLGTTIGTETKAPLGKILRIKENNQLYYLNDTSFHSITDEQIASTNFPNLTIEKASATELNNLTQGDPLKFKDGILFGITGSNKIFVTENKKKRHIVSEDVFNGLGFDWDNIIWVDQFTGLNHATAEPLYLRRQIQIAKSTPDKSDSPASVPVNEKMIKTPKAETTYIGKIFDTEVNTYLIVDYDTKEILAGKNIDDQRPMASFAKVMTAYQLMREGVNLSKSKTYAPSDHKSVYHSFRIAKGEKLLNKHLLYAGLVSSLNTPIKMLVDSIDENESDFIKKMNDQVKAMGLVKTKFTDVTGEDLGNVTTAREYLEIYLKATKNIDVNKFMGLKSYEYDEMIDIDGKRHHYDDHSNLLANESGLDFKIINSKTGYLDEAGAGLTMTIQRRTDNKRFVIISMGNPDFSNRFDEPRNLANWTIERF